MLDSVGSQHPRRRYLMFVAVFAGLAFVGCDGDDDLLPDGPGLPGVIRVFVTSGFTDGNIGGLAGGDTFCTNAAAAAGLSGNWMAWLSDSNTDAGDRIIDARYHLLDGTVVAINNADLTDGALGSAISMDENGNAVSSGFAVWTGTNADGTRATNNCNDWTGNTGSDFGQTGVTGSTTPTWTANINNAGCQGGSRLYCFAVTPIP